MKLPRWLVIVMLASSVLLVLVAAGWWWVTWPERTAREVDELIAAGKWDEARRMLEPAQAENWMADSFRNAHLGDYGSSPVLQPQSRSLMDVLAARQQFLAPPSWDLSVRRGKVQASLMIYDDLEWIPTIKFRAGSTFVFPQETNTTVPGQILDSDSK